jgi:hypothetical protein
MSNESAAQSSDITELIKLAIAEYYTAVQTRRSLYAELLGVSHEMREFVVTTNCDTLEFDAYNCAIQFFEFLVARNIIQYHPSVRANVNICLRGFNRIMIEYNSALYKLEKDVRRAFFAQ